jgi:hypothetical protein
MLFQPLDAEEFFAQQLIAIPGRGLPGLAQCPVEQRSQWKILLR